MQIRYRALDPNGDYTLGRYGSNFLVDSSAAVGQAVLTRLHLIQGEWFINNLDGVPYFTKVIGAPPGPERDLTMQDAILGTPFVTSIQSYSSQVVNRQFSINATINTAFGQTVIQGAFG